MQTKKLLYQQWDMKMQERPPHHKLFPTGVEIFPRDYHFGQENWMQTMEGQY